VVGASKEIATITSATITTLTATTVNSAALTGTTTATMTSANAAALAVGLAGATNPAFVVDSSTGSQAAGLKVTGATTEGTVAVAVISSGSNPALTINAKGSGTIGIGTVSTGAITLGAATGVTGAATVTSAAAGSLTVGRLGATTPAFTVDSSTGTQVAGLKVTGAATAGTVAVVVTDSGADASLTVNAKGSGTIGIGTVSTGVVTITPATTHTAAVTVSGGVVPGIGTGIPRNAGTWCNNTATAGTDTACSNGTAYCGSVFLGANATITGIQYLVGSVGGTHSVVASLHDSAGVLLANSALAGAVVGTAAQVQQVAFTGTYAAKGPAWYFVALTFSGTTPKFRTVPAYCDAGSGVIGNGVTQTFGTAATFTAPTTFTADKVPVASLY
jgi:hypothetical protein